MQAGIPPAAVVLLTFRMPVCVRKLFCLWKLGVGTELGDRIGCPKTANSTHIGTVFSLPITSRWHALVFCMH
jgi:hypothetical protein